MFFPLRTKAGLELFIALRKTMQSIQDDIQGNLTVYEEWGTISVTGETVKGMRKFIAEDDEEKEEEDLRLKRRRTSDRPLSQGLHSVSHILCGQ